MRHKPIVNRVKKDRIVKPEAWQIAEFARNKAPISSKSAQDIITGIVEFSDPWDCVSGRDWSKTKLVTLDDADASQYAFEFGSLVRGYLLRGNFRSASAAFIDAGFIKYFEFLFYHFYKACNDANYPLLKNKELICAWIKAKRVIKALQEISARAMLSDDAFIKLSSAFMKKGNAFSDKRICDLIKDLYNDFASFACWCVRTGGTESDILKYVSKENRREKPNEERLFNEWLAVLAVGCCKFMSFCDTILKPTLAKLIEAKSMPKPEKIEKPQKTEAIVCASSTYIDNGFCNNAFSILKKA